MPISTLTLALQGLASALPWRQIIVALCLLSAATAGAVGFRWDHSLLAENGGPIPASELGFQIEYAIGGGAIQYLDIDLGVLSELGQGEYQTTTIIMECEQHLRARIRALWHTRYSDWSPLAWLTAPDCPSPSVPEAFFLMRDIPADGG